MRDILDAIEYDNYLVVDKKYTSRAIGCFIPFSEIDYSGSFIIITPRNPIEIKNKLENNGMENDRDYIYFDNLLKKFMT